MSHTNDPALLKIHAARVVASSQQPYLSTALFAMVPVRVEGLGTLASDAKWRLYYDPAKLDDWTVEQIAGVLLHEVGHCIRGHADRFTAMGERKRFAKIFNIAGDSLINEDLKDDNIHLPDEGVFIDSLKKIYEIDVSREMSAEQIYILLREKAEEQCSCGGQQQKSEDKSDKGEKTEKSESEDGQSGEGDNSESQSGEGENSEEQSGEKSPPSNEGQAGQGEGSESQSGEGENSEGQSGQSGRDSNCPIHGDDDHSHGEGGEGEGGEGKEIGWDCGSAADGVARDYEVEGDKVDPGVDAERGDLIRQQVAVEIKNHVRNRGRVPAGYERWAKELLEPVVDWRRELASLVRRTYAQVAGLRDYTYQRPSRRQPAMKSRGQDIILPAMRQPNPPKASLVIDTSGSMSDDMLSWALSEARGVLRSLGSSGRQVRVISCDASATSQRVTNISHVELKGGGGTDMRVGITEAMNSRDKPDVVILITDGFTPYPDEPLKGATLIVALTDEAASKNVPDWARKVLITR